MYAADNPREFTFERPGQADDRRTATAAAARWADVLTGRSYDAYMEKEMPPVAVLARLRQSSRVPAVVNRLAEAGTLNHPPPQRPPADANVRPLTTPSLRRG